MMIEILTKADLQEFRTELLQDIKSLIQPGVSQAKQWLKSADVRDLLKISPGTLQNLRINGTLPFTRVGKMLYYKQEDIQKILEKNKTEGLSL